MLYLRDMLCSVVSVSALHKEAITGSNYAATSCNLPSASSSHPREMRVAGRARGGNCCGRTWRRWRDGVFADLLVCTDLLRVSLNRLDLLQASYCRKHIHGQAFKNFLWIHLCTTATIIHGFALRSRCPGKMSDENNVLLLSK